MRGKKIAVLGLTFKPNTDDMRDAPSISIIRSLQDGGARIRVYDPEGMENARAVIDDVDYAEDAYACLDGADAMVLVTEWDIFRALDMDRVKQSLTAPIIVDLRNVYPREDMIARGFTYVGVGR